MNESNISLNRIFKIFKEKKSLIFIFCMLIAGVLLMVFGGDIGSGGGNTDKKQSELLNKELEDRVSDICEEIYGVSNVSVMITIDTYNEQVYAKNLQAMREGEREEERADYVITSNGLVPTMEKLPSVRGIAVVCDGGDEPSVKLKLTEMLCALFSIPSSAVCILGT